MKLGDGVKEVFIREVVQETNDVGMIDSAKDVDLHRNHFGFPRHRIEIDRQPTVRDSITMKKLDSTWLTIESTQGLVYKTGSTLTKQGLQ